MIRKGRFAIWNCNEYELISYQRQHYLKSKNEADLECGFSQLKGQEQAFIKRVSIRELEDAYEIFQYAMVASYRFAVEGYNERMDTVALVTHNPFVKEKLNVRPYGKGQYIIEIPLGEIEIEEDCIPILGFENKET